MTTELHVIEDNGGNSFANVSSREINDNDVLERLEKKLQRAKELHDVGKESSINLEQKDDKKQKKESKKSLISSTSDIDASNVVYAPSIDEVTTDNDHLASLRGEGRYFGVVDPDVNEPTCSNCHRRGHRRAQCKVVVCHACGKVDDHYETQCPNSMVCSNCGEKGHFRNNCPSKRNYTFCVLCDSRNHISERCPTIWRSYVVKRVDANSKIPYPSAKIFCYNCAAKGHYGDDCKKQRISKTPNINGSAFSGENLPKVLISQYKNMLNREPQYNNDNINRKRTYDESNSNYNYAPPPYPRFNKNNSYNNNNNNNFRSNSNNYNNNSFNNNNYNNQNNLPKGPKKGYIPSRNQNSNQGRNNNYNDNRNNNHSTYRPSYNNSNNNNNNNGNYNRGNYRRSWN
ncbi:hypothetical protein C6P40_001966 [Pichia californica]|uniref:CCHC-type domain-containing protein n=1 Tax=Pichia californica TaxID=460514 RepID=A0A9P6WIS3_9ASCO|nr:hypothetical protein C6P42_001960 [[Candida] californica]KAG0687717.1 hypothetical protein C6P40_001966 [[Candida] californica]